MACNKNHTCEHCGDRLIHQQNRGGTESASAFGQLVQKILTRRFAFADVDGAIERTRDRLKLVRKFEWKYPGQKFDPPQKSLLRADAEMLHALGQQKFQFTDGSTLCPESGVFAIEGEIYPDVSLRSSVTVTDMFTGAENTMTPREFFFWLASRSDERSKGDDWMWKQFINWQQRETLAVEGGQWQD